MERGRPQIWMRELWVAVYKFDDDGARLARRKDKFAAERFHSGLDGKEGYVINNCKSTRDRRLLEFMIPLLYPEKPTRITVTAGNTIFGALSTRKVNWGGVFQGVVAKLVETLGWNKSSPISPYLFHLYHSRELLNHEELLVYNLGQARFHYNLTDEKDKGEE